MSHYKSIENRTKDKTLQEYSNTLSKYFLNSVANSIITIRKDCDGGLSLHCTFFKEGKTLTIDFYTFFSDRDNKESLNQAISLFEDINKFDEIYKIIEGKYK